MTAFAPSITLALATLLVVLSSALAMGAGSLPSLPGPYQPIPFRPQGAAIGLPQPVQQPLSTNVQPNPTNTFPAFNFPLPYWMQNAPRNVGSGANPQVNSASNPPQYPQQNPNRNAIPNSNNWGYNSNGAGFFGQITSQFFPGYGAGFGQNSFGASPNNNATQGYTNNNAVAPTNPPQGNYGPRSNWGVQWNGFGYGPSANPWGGFGYSSPNGFNNGQPFGNPNTQQR